VLPLNYIYIPFGAFVFVFVLVLMTISPLMSSLEVGVVSIPNPSGLYVMVLDKLSVFH